MTAVSSSISDLMSAGNAGDGINWAKNGEEIMDKDDFLLLLVTQLQYQDPMNPVENPEFTSQLAQFSSLEQLTNMNNTLQASMETDLLLTQSLSNSFAATLIGKNILAETSRFSHTEFQPDDLRFSLNDSAEDVTVKVVTSMGNTIYERNLGSLPQGSHEFRWDGSDSYGNQVTDGTFYFEVYAVGPTGTNVAGPIRTEGTIEAVRFREGQAYFLVNGVEIPLSEVQEILQGND
ncbi:MAG: hypothetical protein GY863_25310 [bacterium]|nr:hypothetical protein [bacterium]